MAELRVAYRFGACTLDAARTRVSRDGVEVALRPQSFALLLYLVTHADRLVTKAELLDALWPGKVVTEDSLTRCVSEIRAAIGDGTQSMIRTLSRRGYLFAAPVVVETGNEAEATVADAANAIPAVPVALPAETASPILDDLARPPARPRRSRIAATVLALAAIAGIAIGSLLLRPHDTPAPRLTMVVLPFVTHGAGADQDYLGDALTEDLTVALSRLHGATLIATGTAFSFKGTPTDPRTVGRLLDVRYAVHGSVQRTGENLHISATLVDTEKARTLWSDQFDIARADLGPTRAAIVLRLANALDLVMIDADSARSHRLTPAALDAEDLAMQCAAASNVQMGESGAPSYELCERALRIDPRNLRALVTLALYYGERVERVQSPTPAEDLARARAWSDRALDVDPGYGEAHCAHAITLGGEHKLDEALIAAERCEALGPSSARALRTLAVMHFLRVEPERTLADCDRGLALSPRDRQIAAFLLFKGWAYLMLRRDDDALAWLRRADAAAPATPSILMPLISALALTGHEREARDALARYLALDRARTRTIAQWNHVPNESPLFMTFADHFKSGLRRAGMPEG